jgi:hypothetical protein
VGCQFLALKTCKAPKLSGYYRVTEPTSPLLRMNPEIIGPKFGVMLAQNELEVSLREV